MDYEEPFSGNILYPWRRRGQSSADKIAPVYFLYHKMLMYAHAAMLCEQGAALSSWLQVQETH